VRQLTVKPRNAISYGFDYVVQQWSSFITALTWHGFYSTRFSLTLFDTVFANDVGITQSLNHVFAQCSESGHSSSLPNIYLALKPLVCSTVEMGVDTQSQQGHCLLHPKTVHHCDLFKKQHSNKKLRDLELNLKQHSNKKMK
jgi:hypothetical protein